MKSLHQIGEPLENRSSMGLAAAGAGEGDGFGDGAGDGVGAGAGAGASPQLPKIRMLANTIINGTRNNFFIFFLSFALDLLSGHPFDADWRFKLSKKLYMCLKQNDSILVICMSRFIRLDESVRCCRRDLSCNTGLVPV